MLLVFPAGWQPFAIMGYCVGVPVAFISSSLLTRGGPGVAESMGGVKAGSQMQSLAAAAATAVGVPAPEHVYEIPSQEPNAFAASGFGFLPFQGLGSEMGVSLKPGC